MRIKRGHVFSQSLASSKQAINIIIAITHNDTEIPKGGLTDPREGQKWSLHSEIPLSAMPRGVSGQLACHLGLFS